MQRIFDLIFSFLLIIVLSPLFIPIIIILKFTGEGEIFFAQERIGLGGETFKLLKFATMLKNSPSIGTGTITVQNDFRILATGNFLRKTKINELPQLINIFLGNMSLIGPRPQTKRCFEAFPLISQRQIIKVKPGLSGVGSIIFRNEEKIINESHNVDQIYNEIIMPYKGSLEEWYIENNTIMVYFVLILLTIFVVFIPQSKLIWKIFHNLPTPPDILYKWINI